MAKHNLDVGPYVYAKANPQIQLVAPLMGLARVSHQVNRDSEWSLYMYCHSYSYATEHCKDTLEIIVILLWYLYTSSCGECH